MAFSTENGGVSVVIPTMGEAKRLDSIRRALLSLRSQGHAPLEIIIALNGDRFDERMVRELEEAPDVTITRCGEASLPGAIELGRTAVRQEYFCFLDDDDEYLEGAIRTRLKPLVADRQLDFVATNGLRYYMRDKECFTNRQVNDDPFAALIEQNWLASCGFLMRTSAIPVDLFHALPKYIEWTALAFRLMLAGKRMVYLDTPTFRYFYTAGSQSTKSEMRHAPVDLLQWVLTHPGTPRQFHSALKKKISAAQHSISEYYLSSGNTSEAWAHHVKSLAYVEGLTYLPFTRRLIGPKLRAMFS